MRSLGVARWLFLIAGLYGLAIVSTLSFGAAASIDPLDRYGFAGAADATELMYLVIASDPLRYRPLMLVGVFSKLSFAIPCAWLVLAGRIDPIMAPVGAIDLLLAIAFMGCWTALRVAPRQSRSRSERAD